MTTRYLKLLKIVAFVDFKSYQNEIIYQKYGMPKMHPNSGKRIERIGC